MKASALRLTVIAVSFVAFGFLAVAPTWAQAGGGGGGCCGGGDNNTNTNDPAAPPNYQCGEGTTLVNNKCVAPPPTNAPASAPKKAITN